MCIEQNVVACAEYIVGTAMFVDGCLWQIVVVGLRKIFGQQSASVTKYAHIFRVDAHFDQLFVSEFVNAAPTDGNFDEFAASQHRICCISQIGCRHGCCRLWCILLYVKRLQFLYLAIHSDKREYFYFVRCVFALGLPETQE